MAPIRSETRSPPNPPDPAALLAWYDRHRRDLPWRAPPGTRADPYRVWLSEIMLQQTTVATVRAYFDRFTARWPEVSALAAAPLEEVLHAWQGLGYYARARNLHACARALMSRHAGVFPDDVASLRALAGNRRLHRRGDCRDRLRPPGGGGGRQCRARPRPGLCRDGAAADGQGAAEGAGAGPHAAASGRRFRPGDDGSGSHDLHPAAAALRALPVADLLRRRGRRRIAAGASSRSRSARCATAWRSG